jgi:hypothetical protein
MAALGLEDGFTAEDTEDTEIHVNLRVLCGELGSRPTDIGSWRTASAVC